MVAYLRDPEAIYARSFDLIRAEVPLQRFPPPLHRLVLRLVHACGMPDIADDLVWSGDPVTAGRGALAAGAAVLADARMVAAGVTVPRSPTANRIVVTLDEERVSGLATQLETTRSADE
jgi:precorrin-8X/cobalt-precorrin-8 methylmutase